MSSVVPFPVVDRSAEGEPLCARYDPAWWFEEQHFERARQVCAKCTYRSRCLDLAFVNGERLGVWGGLTPDERDRLPDAVVLPMRGRRRPRAS